MNHDRQSQRTVSGLMHAHQWDGHMLKTALLVTDTHQARWACLNPGLEALGIDDVAGEHIQIRADLFGLGSEDTDHFFFLRHGNRDASRLDDPGFLGGDLLDRVAEDLRVLELDLGQAHDPGLDNVGAVQTPTEPGFKDDNIDRLLRKHEQRERSQQFEVGGLAVLFLDFVRGVAAFGERFIERLLRDWEPRNTNAFADIDQVRTREDARGVPAPLKHPLEHVACRALPLGPGDMHDLQHILRIAQNAHERPHAIELPDIGADFVRANAFDVDRGVQELDRGVMIHEWAGRSGLGSFAC